ncbi:DUF1365 family protein [Allocatelliglobosispora scoriae]|uniref:DUF1365 family protein n=1 Tax=Allocatelliglobosispora scoriae TaxID=643052 RepID=A0A841BY46_9ACTN|nr:DUF1365 domain-containing protein [Allocatelliglobosispora scoriae]MBB5873084.1 DUF1365 family protein [Allocatelliglobosispora scoriae]
MTRAGLASSALYESVVSHVRGTPLRHAFRYATYQWLVDLDRMPVLPWALRPLARFTAADHLGDPARDIRANVEEFARLRGVELRGGRILMLAQARVFGYVFNPLTVFWCFDEAGELACVLAEVHNTYGERHCYLLTPGGDDRYATGKEFYVSPFFAVEGEYEMRLPAPDERLRLMIKLAHHGKQVFVATLTGRRRAATSGALLRLALRHPLSPLLASARIRYQGIRLYLRRLPVVARQPHKTQEGVR